MTKRPHKNYWRPAIYIPKEYRTAIENHAKAQDLTVASWVRMLMEKDMGIEIDMDKQIPHGTSPRRRTDE